MDHVHHFSAGPFTPTVAYVLSVVGCSLGLLSMQRARNHRGWQKVSWLVLGAVSIGGTGIWVMHFVAMLGFAVDGTDIRYDLVRTLVSMVVAAGIVLLGLAAVSYREVGRVRLVGAGTITGLGVASMHYVGISAMHLRGTVTYNGWLVALSLLIAVAAATAALWAALNIRGVPATAGAALVMGLAVSGMHYVGMAAMSVEVDPTTPASLPGVGSYAFFAPLAMIIGLVTAASLLTVAISSSEQEIEEELWVQSQLTGLAGTRG
ncbi:diguanylate cyclase/phosphodiesterase (GGDEF & EAL domain) with PAS/PAC sensor(s) [Actinokineospora spheciospongiae]|uniref:Diguanylate cyclase/phosphodiesterase (GGDEF & EAL domain) with PAS/PAC sensor(S) n=1 Tax=Actinokineospora spheciospongiae TaxID=909613 RepID=W7IRA8_9PSEU|nr:MHYT domain-containing protein [Actinokineospora spheciospongiae]EWC63545.1 diguanylate cyclase/phosphodiesterase (GGDEF & EAL domain) with PAS/PAC sensor(s) [Actinokineospora spheciospongiae]